MKKGQKVRVLADNRVGIVADSHFFQWGGKRMVQHQVKSPDTKGDAPWFPADKLTTDVVERATVVITGEKGTLRFFFMINHDRHTTCLEMKGTPENLKEHQGIHVSLAQAFIDGMARLYDLRPSFEVEEY